ncbi:phage holin family protein [Catenulispora yoronensis]|uniref:Phage holin family protein n=1 Tax=Catenulispora yoronensis TaxID=450799 RepID=A0ABN2TY79_9ACTN
MLKRLIASWIILALAFVLAAWISPGMDVHGGPVGWLWIAALFGLLNLVLGTILRLFTAPLMLLTLGLFGIVINAVLLRLVDAWSSDLELDGFGSALWAAILITVLTWLLGLTPLGRFERTAKRH